MLYVVGGCSRGEKSTLAERMRARPGVPWLESPFFEAGVDFHVVQPSAVASQAWRTNRHAPQGAAPGPQIVSRTAARAA